MAQELGEPDYENRQPAGVRGTRARLRVVPEPVMTPTRIIAPRPAPPRLSAARAARAGQTAVPGPIRLTRRGRLVAGVAVVLVVTAICLIAASLAGGALASSHGSARGGYAGMRHVVVEPGQTLWSLAVAAEPAADPRLVIQQIMQTNALFGPTVYAGQQLWVPRS